MKRTLCLLLLVLLPARTLTAQVSDASLDAAKNVQPSSANVVALSNQDILEMSKAQVVPEVITAKIKASACRFDTSPDALQKLKAEGVPDAVLLAMVMASPGATSGAAPSVPAQPRRTGPLKIPHGTIIDIEAPYAVSSQDVKDGDWISFRVVYPVKIEGVTVIDIGAPATARVERAKRGGHFGKAGTLAWTMVDVVAIDGTRVPLEFATRLKGDSKGAKVATQTVLTGVLLWPIAPVALLHGFKRGGNAVIPEGKRFAVFVHGEATVNVGEQR
jgi:hypothetical protein